jgi:hypothetical protein
MTTTQTQERTVNPNGRLLFYHPNARGTGTAIRVELRMNRQPTDRYNCFFLEMARQKTRPERTEHEKTPATFDWEAKATVKLDFLDVCEFLSVFEGRRPHAGSSPQGIYHENGNSNTLIGLHKNLDGEGYLLSLSRRSKDGQQVFKGHMMLTEPEAIGLRSVLQAGLFYMTFHASIRP